jgi:protein O-mannosyl-transferase
MQLLMQKVYVGIASENDFLVTADRFKKQAFDAQAIQGLRVLVEYVVNDEYLNQKYNSNLRDLIKNIDSNKSFMKNRVYKRLSPYLVAKLHLSFNNIDEAKRYYMKAAKRYNDIEANLMMLAELSSKGEIDATKEFYEYIVLLYKDQNINSLRRSQKEYDAELRRIQQVIEKEVVQGMEK